MASRAMLLIIASCMLLGEAAQLKVQANPVRKVVQMLQAMQKKVAAEGEKEKELYEKFMCYCKTGVGDLSKSIGNAESKLPQLDSDLKTAEGQLAETKEGLKQDQTDRSAAKEAMAEATALRQKENAAFVKAKDDYVANIAACVAAAKAIEKGMAGSFLQTTAASTLKQLMSSKFTNNMLEEDRQEVLSFLSNPFSQGYSAQSGQIVGIITQLGDDMATNLAAIVAAEEKAVHSYGALMKAKTSEVNSLTEAVEAKTKKIGDLGVAIVQIKDDIDDTTATLGEDKVFLMELQKGCATKTAEWEERSKTRSAELLALADTVKILNDDDALELFKKTLPAPGVGLVQVAMGQAALRQQAVSAIQQARRAGGSQSHEKLDMILLALSGKKVSFAKVIKMIDDMVTMLKEEQLEDEHKQEYCSLQFDQSDDKKKALEFKMETTETAIDKAKAGIEQATADIAAITQAIKDLDAQVAEATQQRRDENEEYKSLVAADSAAKELLAIAKNRLNRFYNPSLYKPPTKTELSAESRIVVNLGNPDDIVTTTQPGGIANTGVTVFSQLSMSRAHKEAPAPPPETWDAYAKKGGESTGVIAMIDLLIKDLDTELAQAETQEKEDQKDYEALMSEAAKKRADDSKSLADKEKLKADLEVDLQDLNRVKMSTFKELQATMKYIASLHAECDWLIEFFDVRKEARAGEVKSLLDAKAVLSGADYSM